LNDDPAKKTKDADTTSVPKRKEFIKNSHYFQGFRVIVLAGKYYKISDTHNDIEDIFGVKFYEEKCAGNDENQKYWIHWDDINNKTKLVINTKQLSVNVSDKLLEEIAAIIKPFLV
jgi:metal-responsive CopG/Arc/MetJ family transcriptional regulator